MIALTDDYVLSTTSGRLKFDAGISDASVCRAYLDDMTARGILDREKCGVVYTYYIRGAAL